MDGVTKLGQLSYSGDKVEVQAENLRKMFLAMAKDIRVILIKITDRLHNMRTLKYMEAGKTERKARERRWIFMLRLLQRLGISKIKVELDDLSLKYLEPEVYYDLVEKIALRKTERQEICGRYCRRSACPYRKSGYQSTDRRPCQTFLQHLQKMVNQDKTLDQIYDLLQCVSS